MAKHLIIFCKNPRLGSVKTRIAASAGDKAALDIYIKLLQLTKDAVDQLTDATIHVFYDVFIDHDDIWPEASPYVKHLQVGDDLGDRMAHAFNTIFESDSKAKAVIIGSDCATLTTYDINTAFDNLFQTDMVLGPSDDGGYYLLGMQQYADGLFENMEWSTSTVMAETLLKIEALHKTYSLLRYQTDIDTYDQWVAYIL